jgi:hypothetical protein
LTRDQDLQELARRYLELWQEHVATAILSSETSDGVTRIMTALSRSLGTPQDFWQDWLRHGGTRAGQNAGTDADATASAEPVAARPKAAAAPPHDRDERLAGIEARLAQLEDRLARMETGTR